MQNNKPAFLQFMWTFWLSSWGISASVTLFSDDTLFYFNLESEMKEQNNALFAKKYFSYLKIWWWQCMGTWLFMQEGNASEGDHCTQFFRLVEI